MTRVTSIGPPGAGLEDGWRGRCRIGRGRESGTLILGKGACRGCGGHTGSNEACPRRDQALPTR